MSIDDFRKSIGCRPDAVGNFPCDNGALCDACMVVPSSATDNAPTRDRRFDLIDDALAIFDKRACDLNRSVDTRAAYYSAAVMIRYALELNEECLRQFDY